MKRLLLAFLFALVLSSVSGCIAIQFIPTLDGLFTSDTDTETVVAKKEYK